MNLPDTVSFLTWLNQHDARITVTEPEIEIWGHTLAAIPAGGVKAAAFEFFRIHDAKEKPSPFAIRKLAYELRDREHAKQTALTATAPAIKDPITFRERNPELWDQLTAQGRADHHAKLRAKGIEPHFAACAAPH